MHIFMIFLTLKIKYNSGNKGKKIHQRGVVNCPVLAAIIANKDHDKVNDGKKLNQNKRGVVNCPGLVNIFNIINCHSNKNIKRVHIAENKSALAFLGNRKAFFVSFK